MSGPIEKKAPPLKFLLECSDGAVGNFELAKLSEVANLRNEMLQLFDKLVDTSAEAVLAAWLRTIDRNELRLQLLESPDTTLELVMGEAKAQIRNQGRSEEEAEDYGKMPSPGFLRKLPPEERRKRAIRRSRDWEERQIAKGKCEKCPEPLALHSVRYCEKHLAMKRERGTRFRRKKGIPPGRGTQPGTLASLAKGREKQAKVKALLADGAAITLQAAKDSLLAHMPDKAHAQTQAQLFEAAVVPCKTTGQQVLKELLSEGKIERAGKGSIREVYRYFRC